MTDLKNQYYKNSWYNWLISHISEIVKKNGVWY